MAAPCLITPTVALGPLSDSLPVAIAVAACTDDADEPNDDFLHSTPLAFSVPDGISLRTGLFANDEDWYFVNTLADTAALRVTLTAGDAIPVEIYAEVGNAFVGAGMNAVAATVAPSAGYLLHVRPGTAARTCQSSYDLMIEQISSSYICAPNVVISQVYTGGGQTGALYLNDFVELHNRWFAPVSVDGWTIQYGSATGTTWLRAATLAGTIAPGGYFLVSMGTGGGEGAALPAPDVIGIQNMSVNGAKVVLVSSTTALPSGVTCPTDPTVVDFVHYGTSNCAVTTPVPAPSTSWSIARGNNGCLWTGDPYLDFAVQAPNPRNSSWPAASCSVLSCP